VGKNVPDGAKQKFIGQLVFVGQPLTSRELEILILTAEGYTNTEIGKGLFISAETVKTFKRRIIFKLGAKNSINAVSLAYQSGYLKISP
jgi:two-component system response regulator DesR